LDLACGNGRLCGFLYEQNKNINYLGLDADQKLLEIAAKEFPQGEFRQHDLISNQPWPTDERKFDLICIFGLTHHLPDDQQIIDILSRNKKLLKTNGHIVISNWQFASEPERFRKNTWTLKKIISSKKINLFTKLKLIYLLSKMGSNEFLLDWQQGSAVRYSRHIDQEQMEEIAEAADLQIKENFFADGKSNKLNHYFVLSAIK
jgi:2-polyprenyl-3-methyl-5-hydroxy-6-metoxy-1,4-benzoquinol methylase